MNSISVSEPHFGMYLHHASDGVVGTSKIKQIIIPIQKLNKVKSEGHFHLNMVITAMA